MAQATTRSFGWWVVNVYNPPRAGAGMRFKAWMTGLGNNTRLMRCESRRQLFAWLATIKMGEPEIVKGADSAWESFKSYKKRT